MHCSQGVMTWSQQAEITQQLMQAQATSERERSQLHQPTSPPGASATSAEGMPAIDRSVGAEYFAGTDKRPVILFDGVCNMCNGGVNFVLDWDKTGVYRYAALQSDAGRKLLARSGRQPGVRSGLEVNCKYFDGKCLVAVSVVAYMQRGLERIAFARCSFKRPALLQTTSRPSCSLLRMRSGSRVRRCSALQSV